MELKQAMQLANRLAMNGQSVKVTKEAVEISKAQAANNIFPTFPPLVFDLIDRQDLMDFLAAALSDRAGYKRQLESLEKARREATRGQNYPGTNH
jgi:hypothetical protein